MSTGLAFAIPGRWTGGKREEDEMRRLMAAEVAEAKARGELLEETSASDWSSAEDDKDAAAAAAADAEAEAEVVPAAAATANSKSPPASTRLRPGYDTGHEADMDDDTSMSSRASSRMLDSINVISIDSLSVM